MRMVLRAPFSLTPGSRMLDFLHEERSEALAERRKGFLHPDVPRLCNGEAGVTTGINHGKGRKVHVDIEREPMVGAPLPNANAERRDLGAVDVDAGRAHPALATATQQVDDRLLEERHELPYLDAAPGEVDERVDDELAGAVIGDVAAAIGPDQRNAILDRRVVRALPQRVHRRMLEQPQLIRGFAVPPRGEILHRCERRQVGGAAEALDADGIDEGHSTITTEGWSHSSRSSASSWSREVARTTQVTLRYLPCLLGRICTVAGSTSCTCFSTMSVTVWAKPRSFLPITLIGKSHGNASTESGTLGLARRTPPPAFRRASPSA